MEDPAAGEDGNAIKGIRIFKLTLFALIFIVGGLLNILMFLVVTRKRVRHRRTAKSFIRLIQNLACADLLFLFLTVPFDSAWWLEVPNEFPYGGAACKIFWPLQNASFEAIVLTYVMLSFHRTYGIKQALFAQMNDLFMLFIVFLIWIGSLLSVLPYVIFLNYDAARLSCHEMWPLLDDRRAYSGVLFVVQYIVPLMVLLTMYIVAKRELDSAITREPNKVQRKARHRRVNFMLIIYFLIFAFLALPEHICRLLLDFQGANMKPYFFDIMKLLYVLPLLLTVTNPILFFKFNQEFRSDMWYFLGCKCFRGSDSTDGGRRTSASFSIELPPPGENKVPYADIHQAPSASTTMDRPHVRERGSITEATFPGRGSRQPSHQGSAIDMGPRSTSQERFSYRGSREHLPPPEKQPYLEGPPRSGSRQDIPYSSRHGSREHLPPYDQPRGGDRYGDRYGSHDSLPRKEPYPPRGSREPSYHGSRDSLPRKEPPRYEEPYRDPPYRPPSREYLHRDDYRPPSRGSRGSARDAPPYRSSSRDDIRYGDYDDEVDSDQGSEML